MRVYSNLHTHTTYCDGVNSPREMVQAAIERGFRSLGFSGHAYTSFDASCCMTPTGTLAYQSEVRRLQEQYAGRIEIFLGLENDASEPQPRDGYDFIIGSAHYIPVNGQYCAVDNTPELLRACVDEHFGGNGLRAAQAYYREIAAYAQTGKMDILGHFDLVTKFNLGNRFFNADSPAYRHAALEALEAAAQSGVIFEINTGAMTRGFTKTPYPAPFLLKRLLELKAPVILSSDAHAADQLDAHFAMAISLLRDIGFQQVMELKRGGGFVPVPLV